MLYISRIKLKNFKSFRVLNVNLPPTFICFAGPNGSGKCVDGNTEIFLAEGRMVKIRDLVNEAEENGFVEKMDDGYISQYNNNQELLSLDPKTLKIIKKPIAAFVRRKSPEKMLNILTRSGRKITATEYHPLFVMNQGEITPIRADQLKEGTRIAIPRRITIQPKDNLFLELLNEIDSNNSIYVPYDKKIAIVIQKKKAGITWKEFAVASNVPEVSFLSFINSKQAIKFSHLVRILRYCGLLDLEIAQLIIHVKGKTSSKSLTKICWQNSNEFCRFLGYLLAEGSISESNDQIRMSNSSPEIVSDYVNIVKHSFGLKARVYRYKKSHYDVIVNSVPLRDMLLKFGMTYAGAVGKNIPDIILKHSNNENLSHLLSGLYSGDGHVSKSSVEITLKSKKLIKAIEIILLRLGIVPRTKQITKRETKSGFIGNYLKISIFTTENFQIFYENVKLVHNEKQVRLQSLLGKTNNPNVDLIEANSVVKKAVKELKINVKKSRKQFPRLDAYCYHQCLPSRYGINHLLSKVIRPMAIQNCIQTNTITKLETLSNSDIFWDEIEKIEITKPQEEWVYDLSIGETHNFLANGIIVHNSNVGDAIRFALGEISLKSLRAKKVKDLIHHGSKTAEVTLEFSQVDKNNGKKGTQYELKRAIRDDGKIIYRLNGKKTTRNSILDAMKQYNLDDSGRNVIAQGEVTRIINMGGKERRQIIDSVAGISDFEAKKKESLKELGTVEGRIKDANLVLGEREVYLQELAKEKEDAIKYKDARKKYKSAKASLLNREISRFEKEMNNIGGNEDKLVAGIKEKEKELEKLADDIGEVEKARMETSDQLQKKRATSALVQKIEELKASLGSNDQLIRDREEYLNKLKSEKETLQDESKSDSSEINSLEKAITELKKELKQSGDALTKQGGPAKSDELEALKFELDKVEKEMNEKKEEVITLDGQLTSKTEIISIKQSEAESIQVKETSKSSNAERERTALNERSKNLEEEIDATFQRTKDINVTIADIDKKMLELKEQASLYRLRSSPQLMNPALRLIATMKEKGAEGVHGTVADLISFDSKYAEAVEAAGGNRLLYVVVDSVTTATEIISKLRKAKAGRAAFIPLDKIRPVPANRKGKYDPVLDIVKCSNKVLRAVEFVFGDTLLVDSVSDAKSVGIGTQRMVTLQGEIFERSGVISGGKQQSSILSANQLKKLDDALVKAKGAKDALMRELYSIREEESEKRAEKSDCEIRIKTIEMETKHAEEDAEEREKLINRKNTLTEEINALKKETEQIKEKRQKTSKSLTDLELSVQEKKKQLEEKEKQVNEASEESNRQRTELASEVSSLKATIEGKAKEMEIRKDDIQSKEKRIKEIDKEVKTIIHKMTEIKKQMITDRDNLAEMEEKMKSTSKQVEKLFEKIKGFEMQLQEFGKSRAEVRIALDRFNKDLNQINVRKATVATRSEDLKAEFEQYKDAELLEESLKKDELQKIISECEELLSTMGNVNLAAVEMYEKRKQEIDDVKDKIEKLSHERDAIMNMINEIEERKKEAFFDTFYSVSDNFKKMFDNLDLGDGYLLLDNPNDPFESGMHIRIKRGKRDDPIDSLSGGENTLVALMFIFAIQFYKPSPFYILDEVDAALDKENSKSLTQLINNMAQKTQFILVSHNDIVMSNADAVMGVTRKEGISKLVGVRLGEVA